MNSIRKILVTGGSGFIGLNLVKKLHESGFQVDCIDIKPVAELDSEALEIFDGSIKNIHYYCRDLLKPLKNEGIEYELEEEQQLAPTLPPS